MESVEHDLSTIGFGIIEDVFKSEEITNFRDKFTFCEKNVHEICRNNKPDPYDFVQLFERQSIIKMRSYCNESIIETAKGRYDVRTDMVKNEFKDVPETPVIAKLMKSCLKERFVCDIGLLVTGTHAKDGPWHRDTYNLNGESDGDGTYDDSLVMKLKPFYYTILIPLDDITEENGRTEFITGSHRLTYGEAKDNPHIKHDVRAGSIVVFDGRMFHRACAHPSNHPRKMIYLVFHRDWYVDV